MTRSIMSEYKAHDSEYIDIPQQPNLTPSSYSSLSGVPSAACKVCKHTTQPFIFASALKYIVARYLLGTEQQRNKYYQ
jgi:hypothetical protein